MAGLRRAPRQDAALSCGAQLARATATLRASGSPSPELDAHVLLMWLTGYVMATLEDEPGRLLSAELAARYAAWVARRAQSEPVSYITGHKAFMGLDLYIDQRALLVRPFTEALVTQVLELSRLEPAREQMAVDVGTGCGALALALASLEPRVTRIYATDCSRDALAVARINGTRYGMEGHIAWLEGDLLDPVPEPVDFIVANLPYIPTDVPGMAPSVRNFEPHVALFGGADGLDLLRRFIAQVPTKLRPGGTLVMELGPGQRAEVERLVRLALPGARSSVRGPRGDLSSQVLIAQRLP